LRKRFGKRKIALIGISWGTQLGVEMVHHRPDLFTVYVGTAQVTGPRGVRMGYDMALKACRERGDIAGVAALENVGPPPYATFEQLLVRQQYSNPPGQPPSAAEIAHNVANSKLMAAAAGKPAPYLAYPVPPAGFNGGKMFLDTVRTMMMGEAGWEIRDYGRDWSIPIFVFQGEQDFNAPEPLAREWQAEIHAPKQGYDTIAGAGHNTTVFHDELLALMRKHGVPQIAANLEQFATGR
jgi:pimeloyl-ACP methyl ester carboxylesterase